MKRWAWIAAALMLASPAWADRLDDVSVSSAEPIPMLQSGKLDFVATSMTRTPERLREVDFSLIYFVTPHAVIVRKSSGIQSVHQLAGRKAASAKTSTAGGNLQTVVPGVELVYVRDYAVAFGHLKEGKVDAFPTDETVLRALIEQDAARDRGLRRGRKIFTAWFGPGSAMSMKRSFRIQPD